MDNEYMFRVLTGYDLNNGSYLSGLTYDGVKGGLMLSPGAPVGSYQSMAIDSGINDCTWHRMVIDADIPQNTRLSLVYYTTNNEKGAHENDNIHYETINVSATKDVLLNLVHKQKGRYLFLTITLQDERDNRSGDTGPVLRTVMIYYQRRSYLRYLPEFLQEHAKQRDFLERFLSIFESTMSEYEQMIFKTARYIDLNATPDDFIPWLASWMSLDLYELLGKNNRDFILKATELYKKKGTVEGLTELMTFLTGKQCRIKEYYQQLFKTYGSEDPIPYAVAGTDRRNRTLSTTINPDDATVLCNLNSYSDAVHYIYDSDDDGIYTPDCICIDIVVPITDMKELAISGSQLLKIINSFLPAYIKAVITITPGDACEQYPLALIDETYSGCADDASMNDRFTEVAGGFKTDAYWNELRTYSDEQPDEKALTNTVGDRLPHGDDGKWLDI